LSPNLARKERERAAREELILNHARRMLLSEGYQNLNLDSLAKSIEYSKGTIYLHFATKEDLALAVATQALRERAELFERAIKFAGRTRERVRAIGCACCQFAIAHPDFFHVELMLKSVSFWEKASEERRHMHSIQSSRVFRAVSGVIQEALSNGDLPSRYRPEEISFSLVAVTIGSHIAGVQHDIQTMCAVEDAIAASRTNQDIVCDGLGWKPLSNDFDYAATDQRIRTEIFPEATWIKPR